jgi:hypothetical protein
MNSLELNTLSLTELNGVEMKEKQGGAGILTIVGILCAFATASSLCFGDKKEPSTRSYNT